MVSGVKLSLSIILLALGLSCGGGDTIVDTDAAIEDAAAELTECQMMFGECLNTLCGTDERDDPCVQQAEFQCRAEYGRCVE